MKVIITTLVLILAIPCYCYSASLNEDMEDIKYLYSEEEYDFEVAQDAPCRQFEALLIMGSVAMVYNCLLFLDKSRCDVSILSSMISFYFYYVECLPREPTP